MKRILFVDDEPQLLDGLRRMLRDQRAAWEMAFAPGGREALALLQRAPFDVVVSDMRMPGMDGATLLASVKEQFPAVVRIVLSGHTDPEAALRAVPVAHQFLTKPCEPAALKHIITRACALQALLDDPALKTVIGEMGQLPSLPRVYADLTRALAEPDVSLASIAGVVERDMAMCAKLLQLVNSAFFALPRRVTRVQTAIECLGTATLRSLVLSLEVFGPFEGRPPGAHFSLEILQGHALLCASIAKRMLPDKAQAEDAFMAGMLHDIGILVLATCLPARLEEIVVAARAEGRSLAAAEEALGVHHSDIGAYLLSLWGLPYPIIDAVANHHHPGQSGHQRFDAVAAVHIANVLAHELAGAAVPDYGETPDVMDMAYLEALDVKAQLTQWRAMAAEQAGRAADA